LSLDQASNLEIDDFWCRFLVVDDIWIPLGESLLIQRHRPIWNSLIDGFGNHDLGSGRRKGARPNWDTYSGTDSRVFGTEEEWFSFFRKIIESSIEDINTSQAHKIRQLLEDKHIGPAYEEWQDSYKPDLDTYNWDDTSIFVEFPQEAKN
jgi:hypothetical protein